MSTTTLCQLCESDAADHQCPRCATLVCSEHFDVDHGLCMECAADAKRGDHHR